MPASTTDTQLIAVLAGITAGRVVPLLGAGVSSVGRPYGRSWEPGSPFLPKGYELSRYLAQRFNYPLHDQADHELAKVAQYVSAVAGRGTLYDELREVVAAQYKPTPVHQLFAELPAILRERGYLPGNQLVVTTNYDDMMERAFQASGEPYDVVSYIADGPHRGKFTHRLHGGEVRTIENVREYQGIDLERRSLVLKIHGSVDRFDPDRDSYVITEDDYVEYLVRADIAQLLPQGLVAKLQRSHFLFMGHGLRDWNLRVILHRIWGEQRLKSLSWSIQLQPDEVEVLLWGKRNVEVIDADLEQYVADLSERVESVPKRP